MSFCMSGIIARACHLVALAVAVFGVVRFEDLQPVVDHRLIREFGEAAGATGSGHVQQLRGRGKVVTFQGKSTYVTPKPGG